MSKLLKKIESMNYCATRSLADYVNDDQKKLYNHLQNVITLATSALKHCDQKSKDIHKSG